MFARTQHEARPLGLSVAGAAKRKHLKIIINGLQSPLYNPSYLLLLSVNTTNSSAGIKVDKVAIISGIMISVELRKGDAGLSGGWLPSRDWVVKL